MSTPSESADPVKRLGSALAIQRSATGLSTSAAAAAAGIAQSTLWRIEKGQQRPKPKMVRALLAVYLPLDDNLTDSRVEALVAEAEALAVQHVDARVVLQAGGAHHFQVRTRDAEARAKVVRSYHPTTVLGVLQTKAFATAWFTPDDQLSTADATASVAERMRRWEALSQPGREWRLIQTEQALRWPVRDYGLQADQIDQMIAASRLPNVRLRIIRLDTLAPEPAPLTGFHVYDDHEAVVGTDLGTALFADQARVSEYLSRFAAMEALALSPEASRELLARLSHDYRERALA